MLVAVPSFVLSGFTWPLEGMTRFLAGLSQLLPLTHYLDGIRHILIKGNGLTFIWNDLILLFIIGLICFLFAFLGTRFIVFRDNQQSVYEEGLIPIEEKH